MTDAELHKWALERYGSEDLANKLAIVQQLHRDEQTEVVSADFTIVRLGRRRHRRVSFLGR
jgi:ABC-type cobalamin/Fe3+-siderophores transport system ATPase subunit